MRLLLGTGCVVWALPGSTVNAGPYFDVTDLGMGYQLQTDPSGMITGVTSGDGSTTYVLDKVPVTTLSNPILSFGNPAEFGYIYTVCAYFVTSLTNGVSTSGRV